MLDNFIKLSEKIKNNSLKFTRKNANEIIHQYYFHYVDEKSDFFSNFEKTNFIESNTIIINQNEKSNQISDNKYLIISFKRTIFLILITSLNLIKNFFSTKKNLKICFLSNTKDIFDKNINIKYKEIELKNTFLEEIYNLNELFQIHQQLSDSFKEFWKIIRISITSFLIKQSYSELNSNRIQYFFNRKESINQNAQFFDFDEFITLRRIGSGSSFMTDLVYHIEKEKLFVIKMPKIIDDEISTLINRSISNYTYVEHPFIPIFYGVIKRDYFLLLEYINGRTLNNIKQIHLNYTEKIIILYEILLFFDYIHQLNYIYRDLKPDNIMIDRNNNAILIDFDRMIIKSHKTENQIHTLLFASKFLAPEIDTDNFTNKCDIYSFGKMIYYMITEKEPKQNKANEKDDFNENLELFEIYKKCIDKDEKNRPTSDELIEYFYKLFHSRINFDNLLQGCEDCLTSFLNFNKFVAIKSISYRKDPHSQYMISLAYCNKQFLEPNYQKTLYYLTLVAEQNYTEAQYELGLLYYEKINNVNKSIYYLTLAANKNHKFAQFKLGMIYLSKKYIKQDISRSIYYFELAAKQNMDTAQFNLGSIYNCKSVKCYDVNKAIYYLKLASSNNNTLANDYLGSLYYSNDHSLHDINKAIYYFSLGAKQNSPYSQFFLGEIYYNGKYVLRDIKQSIFYLQLSASQNYSYALNLLGDIYYEGICVPKNITKAIDYYSQAVKLDNADSMNNLGYIFYNECDLYDINKAIYYFQLASNQNYDESQFNLGLIYHLNNKIRDIKKAVFYYKKAANNNNLKAIMNLASLYIEGKYIKRDITKAIEYCKMAADKNSPEAYHFLGLLYSEGKYVPRDIKKAIYYYELAVNLNYNYSQVNLAILYEEGKYVQRDISKAIYYLSLAAEKDLPQALVTLASIYMDGLYVPRDLNKAIYYYSRASNKNFKMAHYSLGFIYEVEKSVYDIQKSIHYYSLATIQNHKISQFRLGMILLDNKEIKNKQSLGVYYIEESSKNGYFKAHFIAGSLYHEGKYVKRDINKALHFYKDASSFNDQYAKNNLGVLNKNGFGDEIPKNIGFAIEYFNEAIEQKNDAFSMYHLSIIYLFEESIEINIDKAIEYLIIIYNIHFLPFCELLCIALIMKFGVAYDDMKKEIDKYADGSKICFKCFKNIIKSMKLYDKSVFESRCKFYQSNDYFYDYHMNYAPFYKFSTDKFNDFKLNHKNQFDITEDFYIGFGLDLLK